MTVNQPDGDRQSSSLALLIWLMMTMMAMMMAHVFFCNSVPDSAWAVHHHCRHCYLFWMTTQRQRNVPEKKGQGEEKGTKVGVGVWGR